MSVLHRLVHDLREEGLEVVADSVPGRLSIVAVPDGHLPHPVQISVTEQSLEECLADLEQDAADVFPEVSPREAAYRLFVVHLDEELSRARDQGTSTVVVSRSGVAAEVGTSSRMSPLAGLVSEGGEFFWSHVRPDPKEDKHDR